MNLLIRLNNLINDNLIKFPEEILGKIFKICSNLKGWFINPY